MSIKYAKASSYRQLCPYCRDVVLYHTEPHEQVRDELGRARIAHTRCWRRNEWKRKTEQRRAKGSRAAGFDYDEIPKLVLPPRPKPEPKRLVIPPELEAVAHLLKPSTSTMLYPNIAKIGDGFQVQVPRSPGDKQRASKYFAGGRYGSLKDAFVAAYLWRRAAFELHEQGVSREEILRRLTATPPRSRRETSDERRNEVMATIRKIVQQLWDTLDVEEEARNERRRLLTEIADVLGFELGTPAAPQSIEAPKNGNGNGHANGFHAKRPVVTPYGSRTKVDPGALIEAIPSEHFSWSDALQAAPGANVPAVKSALGTALGKKLIERVTRGAYRKTVNA